MKKDVYVLCGGKSVEHDVSLISATGIINSLNREKYRVKPVYINEKGYWKSLGVVEYKIEKPEDLIVNDDSINSGSISEVIEEIINNKREKVVFPALHGTQGEDGNVQGFLNVLNIPFVGNDVTSSAVCMDKGVSKDILKLKNIPQAKYLYMSEIEWNKERKIIIDKIEKELNYPIFVKPSRSGSSIGINRAETHNELVKYIENAFLFDTKVVVEEEIIGREMQVSVIGNENPRVSVVGEFIQEKRFMDYNSKYIDGKLVQVIPANISDTTNQKMRDLSAEVYKTLGCNGLARVDFFVGEDEKYYICEVNTMPGFTMKSMTPVLWNKTDGTTYSQLLDILIKYAFDYYTKKNSLIYVRKAN